MAAEGSHPPYPNSEGDFRSPEEEIRHYAPPEKGLSGEELNTKIGENFYTNPPRSDLQIYWPGPEKAWAEITGLMASGKHTVQTQLEARLAQHLTQDQLLGEGEIENLGSAEFKNLLKREMGQEGYKGDVAKFNSMLTEAGLFSLLKHIKESEATWAVTTRGPLGSFQLMNQYYGRTELDTMIGKFDLRTQIFESETVTQLAEGLDEGVVVQGMETLATIVNSSRKGTLTSLYPLVDTPIPITFICGLPIQKCLENMDRPSPVRRLHRRYTKDQIDPDMFINMRFVHALMIKTHPDMFIEVNTKSKTDFAEETAPVIVGKIVETLNAKGILVKNPLEQA